MQRADIGPSVREARIPSLALLSDDPRYFLIHHTPADTVDKIDPVEMAKPAAAVAVMTYVVADLPERLEELRAILEHDEHAQIVQLPGLGRRCDGAPGLLDCGITLDRRP